MFAVNLLVLKLDLTDTGILYCQLDTTAQQAIIRETEGLD